MSASCIPMAAVHLGASSVQVLLLYLP